MKSVAIRVLVISVAVGAAVLGLTRSADAAHVMATISGPEQAEAGRPLELRVTLRADGVRTVPNASIVVYSEASFGGVNGEVELARGVTDENGVAALRYEPLLAGEHQLRIEYLVPGETEPEVTTTMVAVSGGTQVHQSTSGIQVPGLNVWLIIALVALVWSILFSVGLRVFVIARASTAAEPTLEWAALSGSAEAQAVAPEAGGSGA